MKQKLSLYFCASVLDFCFPMPTTHQPALVRDLNLRQATSLNMIDMIGVGPFLTIPLMLSAAGGPQAMLGWILGAILAICDGLIWAELGSAMPQAGGSYHYIREIYGARKLGRLLSFLFIWQLSFSAPLSIASGCIGLSQYASYIFPTLSREIFSRSLTLSLPFVGILELRTVATNGTFVALALLAFTVFLLYRRIGAIGRSSGFLWLGVMATIAWILVSGLTHFNPAMAFDFPAGAFSLTPAFWQGLGASMLIAAYDYWGYYNVCFLGGEVKDPTRTIPRALLLSIVIVACLYVVMNISILGVVPWREAAAPNPGGAPFAIVANFMQRIYGNWAGQLVAILIMWTAFASVYSLLLGYSRVPYAAALDGNYFSALARIHPEHRFPHISLLMLATVAALCCFLRLADIIKALVVIRILLQFLVQGIGLLWLRYRRPDFARPFRMWLYPIPALAAIAGFIFILFGRQNFQRELKLALVILVAGLTVYLIRAFRSHDWPFVRTIAESDPA